MDKNHLQGLKNLRKTILNVLEANLDENLIFEKKVTKFTPKYRNFRYFWNFKISLVAGNGRWPAKKSAGRCGLNFFVTKIFFDRQTQKFMILIYKNIPPKKALFWGGRAWIWRPYNCNVTCAGMVKYFSLQIVFYEFWEKEIYVPKWTLHVLWNFIIFFMKNMAWKIIYIW